MQRRKRPRRPGRRPLVQVLLSLTALCTGTLFFCEQGLGSLTPEMTEEVARGYVQECLTQALESELAENGGEYIQVERGGDGSVTGSAVDAEALNALKARIQERLSHTLNGRVTAHVPAGSLTGVALLNGWGPGVPVRLHLEGCADLRFDTEFTTAGVNQTLHRVTLTVTARAYSQSKCFTTYVEQATSTVLAETVVVGPVPQVAVSQ